MKTTHFKYSTGLTNAKEFVIEFVAAHPEFECVIYDWQGKLLLVYDENGKRNLPMQ